MLADLTAAVRARLVPAVLVQLVDAPMPANPDTLTSLSVSPGGPTGAVYGVPPADPAHWRTWDLVFRARAPRGRSGEALERLHDVSVSMIGIRTPQDLGTVPVRAVQALTEAHWLRQDEQERPECQCVIRMSIYSEA